MYLVIREARDKYIEHQPRKSKDRDRLAMVTVALLSSGAVPSPPHSGIVNVMRCCIVLWLGMAVAGEGYFWCFDELCRTLFLCAGEGACGPRSQRRNRVCNKKDL